MSNINIAADCLRECLEFCVFYFPGLVYSLLPSISSAYRILLPGPAQSPLLTRPDSRDPLVFTRPRGC